MKEIPQTLLDLIGKPMFASISDRVEAGAIRLFAAAVEDGFAGYWSDDPDRMIAPPALLSAWNRPLPWRPGEEESGSGLPLHFLVKEAMGLPRAVVVRTETEAAAPVRPGMRLRSEQILERIGEPRTNRLGTGRSWTIRVEYGCADSGRRLGAETLEFFGYDPGGER